ncbi:hypothetical protein SAMN05444374_104290 [Rhodococcoides kroppenstedtii]|uniref:Uncharacterized protein n=1 Tax=Rhodococcoides kroppenstedtii TaxID=293050 RepID=A0A1I0T8A2_9NOCA|nr:hypothetical protein SAMN05444374_104290 [Rhodococcus kroppenstedtii]
MPASDERRRTLGERSQRARGRAGGRRHLDAAQHHTAQVDGDDASGGGADVDAERALALVIDLDRNARTTHGAGRGQIGTLTEQAGADQRCDVAVDGRGGDSRVADDDVTRDGSAADDGSEDDGRRCVGHPHLGRDDTGGTAP